MEVALQWERNKAQMFKIGIEIGFRRTRKLRVGSVSKKLPLHIRSYRFRERLSGLTEAVTFEQDIIGP